METKDKAYARSCFRRMSDRFPLLLVYVGILISALLIREVPSVASPPSGSQSGSSETALLSQSNPYDPEDQPARVYYVAPNGNDSNPGTETQPWLTIQHAADTAEAGSTVYVRGGTYRQRVTINVSGSAGAGFVTFRNYEGETPVLDGTDLAVPDEVNGMFLIIDQSYIIIQGFEICNYRTSSRNRTPSGIYVGGASHHIQLRENRIHHIESNAPVDENRLGADAHGIVVNGTSAPDSIHDIIIDGNELYEMKLGSSEALVLNGNVEHFTVSNNIIHDVDNIAIDLAGFWGVCPNESFDQARSGIVSGNRIYNVSSFGNPAYGKVYAADGIYVDGGKNIILEANIVHEADIGIEIASEQKGRATSGVTVQNNLLYYNNAAGIAMGGYDAERGRTENCLVVNNSLHKNDTKQQGNGEFMIQFYTLNNMITNNIVYANDSNLFISNLYEENANNLVDYNLYFAPGGISEGVWQWKNKSYTGFDQYRSGTGNDSHSLFADPKFVNASGADFHLQGDSPAIDKGSSLNAPSTDYEGNIRPQRSGYDIGAYEYVSGSPPAETVSPPSTPEGPSAGTPGTSYSYSTGGSVSNLGHTLEYQFDWNGDGTSDLSSWGSSTQSKTWNTAETYHVRARARCAADTTVQSDWSSPLTVTISSNGPDLTGSWTTPVTQICKNSSKGQRCTLRGTFTVTNIGNRVAPSTSVDFYLSGDATLDEEDLYLKWSSTGTMKASRSKGMKFSYTLPQGQNASGRYIIAIIDVDDTVTELDEENNIVVFGPIP